MKENYIHVCFIIDESGSMHGSEDDVIKGFQKVIDEQKAIKEGTCSVSFYKFSNRVTRLFIGKDISEVNPLKLGNWEDSWSRFVDKVKEVDPYVYYPGGMTAMYDGIGTAIDEIGKWLSDMPESERPSKNLIVIMTDGAENSSREYTGAQIKAAIKRQEDEYNWSFLYMGTDITTTENADKIGIKNQIYTTVIVIVADENVDEVFCHVK